MQAIAASLHEQELREQQQKKMHAAYSAPAPAPAPAPETHKVASLYNQEVCARVAQASIVPAASHVVMLSSFSKLYRLVCYCWGYG
jgi:hypothetical protein